MNSTKFEGLNVIICCVRTLDSNRENEKVTWAGRLMSNEYYYYWRTLFVQSLSQVRKQLDCIVNFEIFTILAECLLLQWDVLN